MLDVNALERVLDKRTGRGASDESLINWLQSLKTGAWKHYPQIIDGFISAIKQTPLSQENFHNANNSRISALRQFNQER